MIIAFDVDVHTETTVPGPGWYWFIPKERQDGRPPPRVKCMLNVLEDEVPLLNCRAYQGTYIGPFDMDRIEALTKRQG